MGDEGGNVAQDAFANSEPFYPSAQPSVHLLFVTVKVGGKPKTWGFGVPGFCLQRVHCASLFEHAAEKLQNGTLRCKKSPPAAHPCKGVDGSYTLSAATKECQDVGVS